MAHYTYRPQKVCSMLIDFDIDGNVISNIRFTGGCNGNLKAISKILDGWIAVRKAYEEQKGA